MNKKIKNKINQTGNAIVFLIIFCLTLEILARCDDKIKYNAPVFGKYTPDRLREYDSEGIRRNVPNERFEKWTINNLGFRGNDIDPTKQSGKIKIVCMGASETFGLYESENKEWPAQLSDMMGNDYWVINASVVGQFLDKWKPYLDKYVLYLKPQIIILYINPFSYSQLNPVKENADNSINSRKIKDSDENIHNHLNFEKVAFFLKKLPIELRIVPKIMQVIKNIIPEKMLKAYQLESMKKQVAEIEKRKLQGQKKPQDILSQNSIDLFKRDLSDLIEYLNAKHIKIILSTYPMLLNKDNIDKYPDIFYDFRRFYIQLSLNGLIDASSEFNNAIETVAHDHNISFIDINSFLPKTTNEFGDNVHYTDRGAEIVASQFAKNVLMLKSSNE